MQKIFISFILFITVVSVVQGCSGNIEKNNFEISGPIEKIDEAYIYVNEFPIPLKDTSQYEVGQVIKAKLYSLSDTDVYNPDLINLREITTIK